MYVNKREVIEKMIKAYPEKEIIQKTVVNGELIKDHIL